MNFEKGPVNIPITGELDLHTFHARDLPELIPDYLESCQNAKILQVTLIHGKGRGQLRDFLHQILKRSPLVKSFTCNAGGQGSWGRTHVILKS